MKYLLHGDDTASSRKFLGELIEGYQVTQLDGKTLKINEIEEKLLSTSLFEEKKAVVVENLISKNSKKKDFITFISVHEVNILLVLWEDKKLLKTTLTPLKNVAIQEFLLPQNYFQFLDSFAPGSPKRVFFLYQSLLKNMTPEQVFYSLIKRLRNLVVLSSSGKSPELAKMSPWQLSKLQQQARLWPKDKLKKAYEELTNLEIKMKSGKLPVGLSKHLDMLILTHLT